MTGCAEAELWCSAVRSMVVATILGSNWTGRDAGPRALAVIGGIIGIGVSTMLSGPATALSMSEFPRAPSHPTMAPPWARLPRAAAMCSIARRATWNNEHTQHRPGRFARTGAPWHTRTAPPPGTPTSRNWKVVPVGRATPHEDENGNDVSMTCAVCGGRVAASANGVSTLWPGVGAVR